MKSSATNVGIRIKVPFRYFKLFSFNLQILNDFFANLNKEWTFDCSSLLRRKSNRSLAAKEINILEDLIYNEQRHANKSFVDSNRKDFLIFNVTIQRKTHTKCLLSIIRNAFSRFEHKKMFLKWILIQGIYLTVTFHL